MDTQKLEYVEIKHFKTKNTHIKCFKINKNKILISTKYYGLIFNIKVKQVETYLAKFNNIHYIGKVDKYSLVIRNRSICEINLKNSEIYNEHMNYLDDKKLNSYSKTSLINVGNNEFCVLYGGYFILFKYH